MTLQDILALPPGELNRRAAEALGWYIDPEGRAWKNGEVVWRNYWNPATDYNDAAVMRRECDPVKFSNAMIELIRSEMGFDELVGEGLVKLLYATPRQITAAAVWVLLDREKKDQDTRYLDDSESLAADRRFIERDMRDNDAIAPESSEPSDSEQE